MDPKTVKELQDRLAYLDREIESERAYLIEDLKRVAEEAAYDAKRAETKGYPVNSLAQLVARIDARSARLRTLTDTVTLIRDAFQVAQ